MDVEHQGQHSGRLRWENIHEGLGQCVTALEEKLCMLAQQLATSKACKIENTRPRNNTTP